MACQSQSWTKQCYLWVSAPDQLHRRPAGAQQPLLRLQNLILWCNAKAGILFWSSFDFFAYSGQFNSASNCQKKVTVKILKFGHPKICCNHPESWTRWHFFRVMHPKDEEGIANSVDPDQRSSLIWVCTVCTDLSVWKLRSITELVNEGVNTALQITWHQFIIHSSHIFIVTTWGSSCRKIKNLFECS